MIRRFLLAAALSLIAVQSAQAYTVTGSIWGDPATITYQVSTAHLPKAVTASAFTATVQAAAALWDDGSPNVTLVYGGITTASPLTVTQACNYSTTITQGQFTWNADGAFVIGFADLFAATCNSAWLGMTGCYAGDPECDIAIDTRHATSWTYPLRKNSYDGGHIALHELGHALGLGHSSTGCAMYPTQPINFASMALCADDIAGLWAAYP